ncbi:NADH-quinone oxidoreductase subunit NuoE [Orientia tsutsugamushi]|uniref:NADH-quinone oxidoreductase subunit E n=1 Tax=Orientia tsutsugamushi (strain Boryong) TaxID=357244 RepID=A5CES4_ORITB|nr:NADH-quinone oxidoreductase subunit NuoE [Orientia tsutsugamushi]CAM80726.1 NADH dehydrogenase I chain E [Orientia tsutsugamushi str. Boryong]
MNSATKPEFSFSNETLVIAKKIINNYPAGKEASAVLAILDLAQNQNNNWLSNSCIEYVANLLKMPYIKVYEIASFYTMFNLQPVGKYHIQICGTTPCWLRGSDDIMNFCKKLLKIETGKTSQDKLFTVSETECLGACRNAPVVQINHDYYENLTNDKIKEIINNLHAKDLQKKSELKPDNKADLSLKSNYKC